MRLSGSPHSTDPFLENDQEALTVVINIGTYNYKNKHLIKSSAFQSTTLQEKHYPRCVRLQAKPAPPGFHLKKSNMPIDLDTLTTTAIYNVIIT